MRLAFVTPFYSPEYQFGGPPRKIHALAQHLARRGIDLNVLTFDSRSPQRRERIDHEGIPVHYIPWRGTGLKQFPTSQTTLRKEIAAADIVQLFGLYNFIIPPASKIARRTGTPYLAEPLGMHEPKQRNIPFKKIYNRFIGNPVLEGAAKIIATSEVERDELAHHFPADHIVVRRNGIDLAPFQQPVDPTPFLSTHNLDPSRRRIAFLGRLSPIKNLVTLVEAFADAAPAGTDLLLIGPQNEPDYAAELRRTITSRSLENSVHFIPTIDGDEKVAALRSADLFVLPSVTESFGNAAAEAIAAGTPALVTTGCGIAPIIHNRAGLAVEPTADALARGITTLLTDPAPHTGDLQNLTCELSWDTPVDEAIALYNFILDGISRGFAEMPSVDGSNARRHEKES